jgi:hypothetical protein
MQDVSSIKAETERETEQTTEQLTEENGQRVRVARQSRGRSLAEGLLAAIVEDSRRGAVPYVTRYDVKRGAE